jgi:thiamine-monophosphate kinase
MTSELDVVADLIARLPADSRLEVPPGDDAAVLRPPAQRRTVVTVDMLMEGTDFVLGPDCLGEAVGHKALAVSLSDLAAMGSRPEAAVVAVALPRQAGAKLAEAIQAGIAAIAAEHDVALAGGDTNSWDGPLVISTTAIGSVQPGRAWRRDGARPGDLLVVTGSFGGSLLGRHLAVAPRCREAVAIAAAFAVHAAIDVSDGLSLDIARLAEASGVAAVLDLDTVPVHPDAEALATRPGDGRTPLDHALADGEDFELVLALPPAEARRLIAAAGELSPGVPLTIIGELESGSGLFARTADGRRPLAAKGYVHDLADPE